MRLAIAGKTGLIGHAVAAVLARSGHSVVGVGRSAANDVRVDLGSSRGLPRGALSGCDALVHAAGVTDEDFADREMAFGKAIGGAQALAEAARQAGIRRVIYFSSAHVYGPLEGRLDESCPPNPISDYAIAHFAAEQIFRRLAMQSGSAALIVRPCAVFGMPPSLERFARWSLIPFDFPRQAAGGRIVLKSAGTQRRNFVCAEGLGALVGGWLGETARGVAVVNACGPDEMSVYDFAVRCARIANAEIGRECPIERPGIGGGESPLFEYRARSGERLGGIELDDHVRSLIRALSNKSEARP